MTKKIFNMPKDFWGLPYGEGVIAPNLRDAFRGRTGPILQAITGGGGDNQRKREKQPVNILSAEGGEKRLRAEKEGWASTIGKGNF